MLSQQIKLELLAQELCLIRYPDIDKKTGLPTGKCIYVWDMMSEDHQQMFIDSAKCAFRFAIKELETVSTFTEIEEKISELRQVST